MKLAYAKKCFNSHLDLHSRPEIDSLPVVEILRIRTIAINLCTVHGCHL